jgi:hypothetical protein
LVLTLRVLLYLTQTGKLVHQEAQDLNFVCRVVHVDHLLSNLLSERHKLPAELFQAGICINDVFLRCCDCGCWWCRLVPGVHRGPQPLCHLSDLVDSALSEAQPKGPEVEHPNVPVLVISLIVHCSSLGGLAAARSRLAVRRRLRLAVLPCRKAEAQSEDDCRAVASWRLPVPGNRSPASRTHLLPLQPALKAAKVKDMATRELLRAATLNLRGIGRIPGAHFLSADDARVLSAKLLRSSIRVLVHVLQSLSVADEGMESLEE